MTIATVRANGAEIPALGLGTATLMGESGARCIAAALGSGYRLIDTAARYGNEEAVGEGLRASGVPRSQVTLVTKVYWTDLAEGDFQRSAEQSLKRLGVDRIDLLLIHWPNPKIPLKETVSALNDVKSHGLASHIGVANFTTKLIAEAVQLSAAPLAVNQIEYHPYIDQSKLLEVCRKHGIAMMAYSPLRQAGPGSPLEDPVVVRIAAAKGVTPAQAVLRWHLQQGDIIALPRSSNLERIRQNADIDGFDLSADDMAAISALKRPDGRKVQPKHAPVWD
jgi:diketogulonate reductase-like aldo/keto reductase